MTIKRTERGWAGHYVAASHCRFRRNTLLQHGRTSVVVSTVGDMHAPQSVRDILLVSGNGPDEIGASCYYETMAFVAVEDGPYIEADVTRQVFFDSEWRIGTLFPGVDNQANDMHEAVVAEITHKMLSGEIE